MSSSARRVFRVLLVAIAAVVVLAAGAVAVFVVTFDPNAWKPRIEAAVERATGRTLQLDGPLALSPGLVPRIVATEVRFANAPGLGGSPMATVQRLAVSVELLPLLSHRVVVDGLALIRPSIVLQRDANGVGNWVLRRAATLTAPAAPAAPGQPAPREAIAIRKLSIEDGRITWRSRAGVATVVEVPRLELAAPDDGAPLTLNGSVVLDGLPVSVAAQTGPLARLQDSGGGPPWPVQLTLAAAGAQATAQGTIADPARLQGYALEVTAQAPDLAHLQPLLPRAVPALRDVAVRAHVVPAKDGEPAFSALELKAGASDLAAVRPGLRLVSLHVAAPSLAAPAQFSASLQQGSTPVTLSGTAGPLQALRDGGALAVDARGQAGGADMSVRGTLGQPAQFAGKALAVSAQIPDLASLSPLAGRPLPGLRDVVLQAQVADMPGAASGSVALHDLRLTSADGDLSGDAMVGRVAGRPTLRATLESRRLDADAALAAWRNARAVPGAARPAAARAAAPAPPVPAPPQHRPTRLIPDTALPLNALTAADADLRLRVADLRAGGVAWRDLSTHVALVGGLLVVNPLSVQAPGGHLDAALSVDARQAKAPPVALMVHGPAMALRTLLAGLGLPADASGTVQLDADLHGAGRSSQAIAAGLDGHLGLSLVDGEVDNQVLVTLFGDVLRSAKIPADLGAGRTHIRCLALRADATHGQVRLSHFLLDTSRLHLEGDGTADLATETLDLRLRPLLRFSGNGIAVPVRVTGSFLEPKARLDALGGNGRVGALIGALSGLGASDACGPALAAARGGQAGPMPSGPAPKPTKPLDARELLRKLFR